MPFIRRNSITFDPIAKKFTKVNDPPEKPLPVELTEEEKRSVIAEFKDIFGRSPNEAEIEELFLEEVKLKQEGSER